MPDILIRGLDTKTVGRLKARAKRSGRSLQGEARQILEHAAGFSILDAIAAGERWQKKLGRKFSDSVELIRADRAR